MTGLFWIFVAVATFGVVWLAIESWAMVKAGAGPEDIVRGSSMTLLIVASSPCS